MGQLGLERTSTEYIYGGPDIPPAVGPGDTYIDSTADIPGGVSPADTTGENGSEELPGAVPLWMWLAGGAAIVFVLSRR